MEPIVLAANQPRRFYRGGAGIARFRGTPQQYPDTPEDFIASTTEVFGGGAGLSKLGDGRVLRDLVNADPQGFLGPEHVAAYGSDVGLLVKMLDTGQRLLTHFHPSAEFAARHLGCAHGKNEAWIITEVTEAPGDDTAGFVYLGFAADVDAVVVADWVARQDTTAILRSLNKIKVRPGDVFFVPAGIPHGIGTGITLMELQEPTDLSIMLEWAGHDFDGAADGHLNLGFDIVLQALDRQAWTQERLAAIRSYSDPLPAQAQTASVLPGMADEFFRAERITLDGTAESESQFAIVIVFGGEGTLQTSSGTVPLGRGSTVLVPFGAGSVRLGGRLSALRCLPPAPALASPRSGRL
jgi:mannose-6-phosphate isomerase